MKLILYAARCTGNEKNCLYPDKHEVTDADSLLEVIRKDHVCAEYKGNYRNNDNFLTSQCVVMDCDNDQSEDPATWVTPEALADEFENVPYAITFSRHHMKEKNGKPARPKFHVYFQISPITDPDKYAKLKEEIQKVYPFFDNQALDAGRFIYGCESEKAIWP